MDTNLHHPYKVDLDVFEGPLDLLLHLIKKSDLDILDIPIHLILEQYLQYLNLMEEMNIDLAGDFLLMASELAHIKSKMLLPDHEQSAEDEAGEDPRGDLIKRLLEYQRYKEAAQDLLIRPMLGRDVFGQGKYQEEGDESESPMEVDLFSLIHCFYEILDKAPKGTVHQVHAERISVTDRIYEIMAQLKDMEVAAFSSLFEGQTTRERLIVTFLAILEMARMKMLKITQAEERSEIYLKPSFETAEVQDIAGNVTLQ
jgi:segregation and condensation protein A